MLIIGIIFSFFIKIPNYFLFLFTGLLPWQFFSLSLNKTTGSFVNERALLQKAKFPKEVIPISIIFSNFIHLLISLLLFLIFLLVIGKLSVSGVMLIIPALLWLLAFTIGASLFTASLNVRFRDINFFVQSLMVLWFYATPILYNLSLIPTNLRLLFALNPLTSVFELFHYSLLGQGEVSRQFVVVNLIISLGIVIVGIITYSKRHPYFVDWL